MRLAQLALRLDAAADETRELAMLLGAGPVEDHTAAPAGPGRLDRLAIALADQVDEVGEAGRQEGERIAWELAELAGAVRTAAGNYLATDDGPGEV